MKSLYLSIFTLALLVSLISSKKPKSKSNLDKFARLYNPDKAAKDCNNKAWRSCYEIRNNKCISWGWTPIASGCVVIFEKCNYKGTAQIVCGDLKRLITMNKKISSIKLGPKTSLELFSKKLMKGTRVLLKFNEPCLKSHRFSARAQSLRVSLD